VKAPARVLIIPILAAALIAMAGPASADHADVNSHWGHGYQPLVSADCSGFGGTFCNYTATAENTWLTHGYPNGVRGGNPYQGCGQKGGWILDCVVSAATVHSISGCETSQGCSQEWFTFDPNMHIDHTYMTATSCCTGRPALCGRLAPATRGRHGRSCRATAT
jgi:hypothetical protein